MAKSTFQKRFAEIVQGLTDKELGEILGVTPDAARKMRVGDTKSLKLHAALRLARELNVSPWYLVGEPEPTTLMRTSPAASSAPRRRSSGPDAHRVLAQAQRQTAEGALLIHDEVVELRSRVGRLERSLESVQEQLKALPARS